MKTSATLTAHDGTSIWYGTLGKPLGSAPALVLCDGFACDGFIWAYIIDHFCDELPIVRWHYRGHGRSGAPQDPKALTIEDVCADLELVLDALGIEDAILAGHSMGAQVIFQSYAMFPERIRALIPICGTFMRPLDTFNNSDTLAKMLPWLRRLRDTAPWMMQVAWETIFRSQLSYFMAHLTELNAGLVFGEDFKPYLEHTGNMDLLIYLTMLANLAEHSAEDILPTIEAPTLIIASEFDSFTPLARSYIMHERVKDSELVILAGGSHAGPIELPDTVTGAMEKFLRRHRLFAPLSAAR